MKHGEILGISQNYSCCASYPEKCWLHSLEEVRLMCEFDVTWVEDLLSYFKENLDLVERNLIYAIE